MFRITFSISGKSAPLFYGNADWRGVHKVWTTRDKAFAGRLVERLNKHFPELKHTVVEVK